MPAIALILNVSLYFAWCKAVVVMVVMGWYMKKLLMTRCVHLKL